MQLKKSNLGCISLISMLKLKKTKSNSVKVVNMEKIILNKNSKVLFIGDSITDVKFNSKKRFSFKGNKIYALQLKKRFKEYSKGVNVEIKGIASNRTYHVYDRLTKDCINLDPDVIIMLIGVIGAVKNIMGGADTVLTNMPTDIGGLAYLMPIGVWMLLNLRLYGFVLNCRMM